MTLQSMGQLSGTKDATLARIAELAPWFHNLHLPSGHQTAPDHPLGDFPAFKWRKIAPYVGQHLHGLRALDIGCNAGYYSFELAARGARVVAVDSDEHYLEQARWAAEQLDPGGLVEFKRMQVYELAEIEISFDLVLFLGVIYHLRYPQLALDLVAELVGSRMILQTMTMPGTAPTETPADIGIDERSRLTAPGWPRAAFVEHALAGDATNWWVPDDACIRSMVRSAGLSIVATPAEEIYVCKPEPGGGESAELRRAELRAVLPSAVRQPAEVHAVANRPGAVDSP
jgi:tRNA (mo5U34)-methyltransferase